MVLPETLASTDFTAWHISFLDRNAVQVVYSQTVTFPSKHLYKKQCSCQEHKVGQLTNLIRAVFVQRGGAQCCLGIQFTPNVTRRGRHLT